MIQDDVIARYMSLSRAEDWQTRSKAIETLESIGGAALLHLVRALEDPHYLVRRRSLLALARLGGGASPALPACRAMLRDEDPAVRLLAVHVLASVAPTDPAAVLSSLCEGLIDEEREVRRDALKALRRIGRRLKRAS